MERPSRRQRSWGWAIAGVMCASLTSIPLAGCFTSGFAGTGVVGGTRLSGANRATRPSILTTMVSGPAPGEVRNPWGRAGKPETRAARQKEQEETVELRAKAWRMAMERNGDWDAETTALTDYVNAFRDGEGGSMTTDIEEFHERAISLLRESGGRMNSLTFGYKWEQQFGESLAAFARMQRLSVAEMLRQSNRFWVVDMQGTSSSGIA
eukprot:CAMPEP_0173396948 /NCGR_PEP_ID=MMETSP1356-20130122/36973_1 /TAXON_ID=77927 ORGANISM="Hemiselmis virescens, Strain PCC157" /NCGR_SAMPLE_ID=MMETSP1356 /ASSEMBLY_ACC=CAM_ASM_000847 /LENGTH=208 /DNA_ID=CAMNT_0014356095 /DNA_START=20 /DNA_END=643 /DNA_ORIENTATION=-